MTLIMLIMILTLLPLVASQGSLALVPEGMWHNNNNICNTPTYGCTSMLTFILNVLGEVLGIRGSVKVTCVRKMADAAAHYCVFYLY